MHGLRIDIHQFVQVAGNGSLQLWPGVVQCPQPGLKCDGIHRTIFGVLVQRLLLLLESPEVVLDEERGVKLAYRHLVVNCIELFVSKRFVNYTLGIEWTYFRVVERLGPGA